MPDYGSADAGGFVAYGCLAPKAPDDVHLFEDLVALIQPGAPARHAPGALLLTTLRVTTALVLLNVAGQPRGDRPAAVRLSARGTGVADPPLGHPQPREAHRGRDDVPGQ